MAYPLPRSLALILSAGTSLATVAIATPALAQDAEAEPARTDTEIVVTPQFHEQRLQDTPLAITAVDAELLESRNQDDIAQIAAQAPSVTLQPTSGACGNSLGGAIKLFSQKPSAVTWG
ncbi:hypothetical protein [Aurantiacibacter suaedae]|uniref:hypothetical protein n=1 Tax=Aurantiacibacter suaedae TaxID=2545755 RepID=UPI0018848048|nr:hypothetical protein [Aurantiacibacter suaedae]